MVWLQDRRGTSLRIKTSIKVSFSVIDFTIKNEVISMFKSRWIAETNEEDLTPIKYTWRRKVQVEF